jgi:hypothetical protein
VRQGGFVFRSAGDVVGHHDAVRFTTYMVPAAGGPVAWTGFVFLQLGTDGRIRCDISSRTHPPPRCRREPIQGPGQWWRSFCGAARTATPI